MRLRDIVITLLFVSIVVTLFSTIAGGFETQYGVSVNQSQLWKDDANFNETFSKINDMKATTGNMSDAVTSKGLEGVGAGDIIVGGTWNVVMMVFGSIEVISTLVFDLSATIGIPMPVTTAIIGIITVFIIFSIISLVTRRDA